MRGYKANMIPGGVTPTINVSQYDNDYAVTVTLIEGAEIYTPPVGATIRVEGTKPDGHGFEYPCTYQGNVVTMPIYTQMTVVSGRFPIELVVYQSGLRVGSCNIIFAVEKAPLGEDTDISETVIPDIIDAAQASAEAAQEAAETAQAAEAWAVGQRDGVDVPSTDGTYHNNAKYYAQAAAQSAASLTVDTELSSTSTNPVQNKVIDATVTELKNDYINSRTDIQVTWEDGGLDPTTGDPIEYTNGHRTGYISTSDADTVVKSVSPGVRVFYYNYIDGVYSYVTMVWVAAGTTHTINKGYTHFRITIVATSIAGLSVRKHIDLYDYAHGLEPRIQSNETAITGLNADVDAINTKLDGMIPSETYTGAIIAEEFSGSPFNSIEIDTTDTSADLYVCGKNIYPKYSSGSANGLSWTVADDGTISFTGTPTADTFLRLQNLYFPVGSVECSFAFFNNMTNSRLSFFGVRASNTNNYQINLTSENAVRTAVIPEDLVELRLRIPKDTDWTGLTLKPMFVIGSAAGSFEAYKGGKTTVTLTNGKVNESITAFSGINTVWSNKGAVTVTATSGDLIDYINSNLEEIRYSGGFYKFTQSGDASYLNVYFASGENFIGYELHNVPAPLSNSDTWQLGHTVAYKFDGTNLSDAVELIEGGEYELAMRENGAADYCGGNNHGDENTVTFKLFIDGEQITDLSAFAAGEYKTFNRIDAFDISLVDRCTDGGGTPGDHIARHQKHWTFEGGKVEVQQTLKFLQNLRLDVVLLCMCCATRSQFPYGIRQGAVDIEDMSVGGFSHITTRGDDASYFYFGDNATINIKAKTDSPTQSTLYINSTATQNKLYYGYYQATNSASPTEVTAGTVIQETSLYDVAYN